MGLTIVIDQEWGFQHWLWETEMTEAELIEFWQGLEHIPYTEPPSFLPGKFKRLLENESLAVIRRYQFIAHFHMDDDSHLRDRWGGQTYVHKGYENE
jgi:hypothetical protein